MESKCSLIILFGGRSAEHDVSCISARHVIEAADPDRYDVIPVGITKNGEWSLSESAIEQLRNGTFNSSLEVNGPEWNPFRELKKLNPQGHTVVFPLLHGPFGEDGTIQGLLEVLDVPYIGSGVLSSSLAMNKIATKEILTHHGIPQARYRSVQTKSFESLERKGLDSLLTELLTELGPIVFVKPCNLGSSVGVSRADNPNSLKEALDKASTYDEWLIVEEAIKG